MIRFAVVFALMLFALWFATLDARRHQVANVRRTAALRTVANARRKAAPLVPLLEQEATMTTYGMFTQQQVEHALERCNLMLADPFLTPGAWVATFRQMFHYGQMYNERWAPKRES